MEFPEGIKGSAELEAAYRMSNPQPAGGGAEPGAGGGEPAGGGGGGEPAGGGGEPAGGESTFDLSVFGDYKSPEELKAELDALRGFKTNFGASADVDEDLFRLSHLKKTDPDAYSLYAKLKISGDVDDLELLVNDHIQKFPEYKDRRDFVTSYIKRELGLDVSIPLPAPDDASDEEKQERQQKISDLTQTLEFAKMKLKERAIPVRGKLDERFNSIPLPAKKPEITPEVRGQIEGNWTAAGTAISGGMTVLPVFSVAKDGNPVKAFDFNLDDSHKAEIARTFKEIGVKTNNPAPTSEQAQEILATAITLFRIRHEAEINSAFMKKVRGMTELEISKMYDNPAPLGGGGSAGAGGSANKFEESRQQARELEGR